MVNYIEKPILIHLKVRLKTNIDAEFADWQAQLNAAIAGLPGFISLEFLCPFPAMRKWEIVQRFGSMQEAVQWKESQTYRDLMDSLQRLSIEKKETVTDVESLKSGITEVIVVQTSPEKEAAFRSWMAKIHLLEARFPGFRGVYVQSPNRSNGRFWITLLQFDTAEHLDLWLHSPERQSVLEESKALINYMETHRVISPYAGWFATIARVGDLPALWKQTMVILLVLFPIVMLEFKYLNPHLKELNISLSTFIGNAISVSLISFPMMPIAIRCLRWWLTPELEPRKGVDMVGTLVVMALYLLEIWIFWS